MSSSQTISQRHTIAINVIEGIPSKTFQTNLALANEYLGQSSKCYDQYWACHMPFPPNIGSSRQPFHRSW